MLLVSNEKVVMIVNYLLVVCSCLIGAAYGRTAKELKLVFMQQAMVCAVDYPVTPEEIELLHKHIIPDTTNAKCLLGCVFKKDALINEKGMLDVAAAEAVAEKEHLDNPTMLENSKKIFEECKPVNDETVTDGEKGCDRAALLAKCLIKNLDKYNFKL